MTLDRKDLASSAWAVAIVAAAMVSWFEVFPFASSAWVLVVAVVLPGTAALLAAASARATVMRRTVAAGVAAGLAIDVVLAVVDRHGPLDAIPYSLALSWKHILTVPLPVPTTFQYLAGPVLLLSVAVSVATLARGRPSWQLFVPAAVVWLGGILLGVGGPLGAVTVSAPLAILVSARLVTADLGSRNRETRSRVAAQAAALTVVAGVLATLVATPIAGLLRNEPFDPRSLFSPELTTQHLTNPLDQLSAQLASTGGPPVLDLRASGPVNSPFVTLATFATFDGARWQVSGAAAPMSGPQMSAPPGTTAMTETVTGSALTAPWVPHTGEILAVDTPGLVGFRSAGVLVDPDVPPRNDYTLQVSSLNDVDTAPAAADPELLDAGCLPTYFRDGMAQAAAGETDVAAKVALSMKWLRDESGLVPARTATGGHSCSRLEQLAKPGGDKNVTSEQAATILALGLRSQGLPARLAYGYRLGQPQADGSYAPAASDAAAFTQVKLEPVGWVSVDAAPGESGEATAKSDLPAIERKGQKPLQPGPAPGPASTAPPQEPVSFGPIIALGAIALLVAGAVGWLAYAARRRRRFRRDAMRQVDMRAQVMAAWVEAIAALARAGVPVASGTMSEVGRSARSIPGATEPTGRLASLAEHALYNPEPMPRGAASAAFARADQVIAAVRSQQSRLDRIKVALDPRSAADVVAAAALGHRGPITR